MLYIIHIFYLLNHPSQWTGRAGISSILWMRKLKLKEAQIVQVTNSQVHSKLFNV